MVDVHDWNNVQLVNCSEPDCHRRGEYGFAKRDELLDHLREVHGLDLPKRLKSASAIPSFQEAKREELDGFTQTSWNRVDESTSRPLYSSSTHQTPSAGSMNNIERSPLSNSFDSKSTSMEARNGPFGASVPSRPGIESPPSFLPSQLGNTALHDLLMPSPVGRSMAGVPFRRDSSWSGGVNAPLTYSHRSLAYRTQGQLRTASYVVEKDDTDDTDDEDDEDGDLDRDNGLMPRTQRSPIRAIRSQNRADEKTPAAFLSAAPRRTLSSHGTLQDNQLGSLGSSSSRYNLTSSRPQTSGAPHSGHERNDTYLEDDADSDDETDLGSGTDSDGDTDWPDTRTLKHSSPPLDQTASTETGGAGQHELALPREGGLTRPLPAPGAIVIRPSPVPSTAQRSAESPNGPPRVYELPRLKAIEDLTALTDTHNHFAQQEDVERKIVNACGFVELFTTLPGPVAGTTWHKDVSTSTFLGGSELAPFAESVALMNGVLESLVMLESNGLCAEYVDVFIEDMERDSVITTVGLSITDIRELGGYLLPDRMAGQRRLQAAYDKATQILSCFGGSIGRSNAMSNATSLALTCSLLAISLATFAGSHCSEPFLSAQMTPVAALILEDQGQSPTELVVVRQQQLSCLSDFVGGPVWVIGSSHSGPPKMLSISTEQIARLWGPIYAVPEGSSFNQLLALNTDGGVIHHTPSGAESLPFLVHTDELLMHWTSTSPVYQSLNTQGFPSGALKSDSAFPIHLPPFPSHKRLLIGHPQSNANGSCVSLTSSKLTLTTRATISYPLIQSSHQTPQSNSTASTSPSQIDAQDQPPSGLPPTVQQIKQNRHSLSQHGFQHNVNCASTLQYFAKEFRFHLAVAGTHNAHYVPDQYQASFGAGQYVNAGIQKTWRRRPASKMKTMLLEYCTKPGTLIRSILALHVGLEVSMCTSNAQRISLWEALQIAFPAQRAILEAAYADEDSACLSSYLSYLTHTGITPDKTLSCFWPLENGLPQVLRVTEHLPEWMAILHDTPESACFAVSSPRCLTYYDIEEDTLHRIRSICRSNRKKRNYPVLRTTIDLHPDAATQLPLNSGARMRLGAGSLEIRDTVWKSHLAVFRAKTLLNRVDESLICTLNGQNGHTHRELFDHSGTSLRALLVCVDDR